MNVIQKENKTLTYLLCLLVILTNLSQMPIFVSGGITQYISMPLWIILFIYCVLHDKRPEFSAFKTIVSLAIFFGFFYQIASALNPAYQKTSLPSVLMISLFVLVCSSCIANDINVNSLNKILTSYVLSVIIVGISVYMTYIANASLTSRVYLYEEKNSISQILLTAWVIILFTKFDGNWKKRLFYLSIMAFFTYEILMLQSRASIIGIPIALAIALLNGRDSKGAKTMSVIFILVAIVLLFKKDTLDYFVEYVLYAGRNSANLNDLSSGRSEEWAQFSFQFDQNPLFGVGKCKRESIILTSLLEFGIVGGIPLLIIACSPLLYAMRIKRVVNITPLYLIYIVVAITYTINGIFEQLAPFGPGVKCYFLWFLYGIIATKIYSRDRMLLNYE